MTDGAKLLCCYLSPSGTRDKQLVSMRMVGYFAPLQTAVLNLTVIFKDHRGQKNLGGVRLVRHTEQRTEFDDPSTSFGPGGVRLPDRSPPGV